jgi:PPOX class probable F420-dependent enzyme
MRLSVVEARDRFTAGRVARLATSGAGERPLVVPVTFAVTVLGAPEAPGRDEEMPESIVSVVDHKPKSTSRLRRLRHIRADPRVSLLVDHYEEDWSRLWWARADGRARVVPAGEPDHAAAVAALAARYPQYRRLAPSGPAIVVTDIRWSGWSFAEPGGSGGSG